jgi:WD40 repeat protein
VPSIVSTNGTPYLELVSSLLASMSSASVAHIAQEIHPRLHKDFISELPPELAIQILSNLDTKSLCHASEVSRRWRELALCNYLWRHLYFSMGWSVDKQAIQWYDRYGEEMARNDQRTSKTAANLYSSSEHTGHMVLSLSELRERLKKQRADHLEAVNQAMRASHPEYCTPVRNRYPEDQTPVYPYMDSDYDVLFELKGPTVPPRLIASTVSKHTNPDVIMTCAAYQSLMDGAPTRPKLPKPVLGAILYTPGIPASGTSLSVKMYDPTVPRQLESLKQAEYVSDEDTSIIALGQQLERVGLEATSSSRSNLSARLSADDHGTANNARSGQPSRMSEAQRRRVDDSIFRLPAVRRLDFGAGSPYLYRYSETDMNDDDIFNDTSSSSEKEEVLRLPSRPSKPKSKPIIRKPRIVDDSAVTDDIPPALRCCVRGAMMILPDHQTSEGYPRINWYALCRTRSIIENRWRTSNYKTHILSGHEENIYCIQFNDRMLVSGSRDRTIRLWDMITGEQLRILRGHTASVLCLQYDEEILVTGGGDHIAIVWDINTGKMLKKLIGHTDSVLNLCLDKKYIVTCSKDRSIIVWSRKDYSILRVLRGHRIAVNGIAIHGNRLASASGDRTVRLWNLETGECIHTMSRHSRGIACIQFDGKRIFSGSSDRTIRIWNAETGECIGKLEGHTDLVRSLDFNGRWLVSGSYDRSIRVWDIERKEHIATLHSGHDDR